MSTPSGSLSPLPIRTPFDDGKGLPSWPWLKYIQELSFRSNHATTGLEGTHAQRLSSFPPGIYSIGSTFYETDRTVLYLQSQGHWIYFSGIMNCLSTSRPADLGPTDTGFLAYLTDLTRIDRWNGAAWVLWMQAVQYLFSDGETPSGVVDGANSIFTLAHAPSPASSLQLYNGIILSPGGTDYTLTGNQISTVSPPSAGSVLKAWYRY